MQFTDKKTLLKYISYTLYTSLKASFTFAILGKQFKLEFCQ